MSIWYSFGVYLVSICDANEDEGKICGDLWKLRAAWLCLFTWATAGLWVDQRRQGHFSRCAWLCGDALGHEVDDHEGREEEQRTRYLAMVHGTGCLVSMIGAERIQEAGQTP